ncbi:olfactory receptor 2G3-like [Nannospalax galili]|uniref:olfactory receptor 2G3-like n=1 Tax=Nannospalax galili TaxID=1026970 RepID=UPI000819D181|nr:olfactory receptor 2G3-like [Nannospalax galili]
MEISKCKSFVYPKNQSDSFQAYTVQGAMEGQNQSFPTAFVLLGFSDHPWLEIPLFGVVLVSYIFTLMGNSSIILLSLVEPRLQTPMYFFLDNLSVLDLCLTCTTVPQLLVNLLNPEKTIAAWGCIIQVYIFSWIGCTECALLAVMAFDRYVAICCPLQYVLIMRLWSCVWLTAACWASGLANSLLQATLILQLPLCGKNTLDHFFCEMPALSKLACGDTTVSDLSLAMGGIVFSIVPPLVVLISYIFITRAVLKLPSAEGRHKAFNTCSSHLLVVTLFYGPCIYMYLQPPANSTQAKFLSLFYCVITPLLNPLIYTLRNKDVKAAWRRGLPTQGRGKSLKAR